VAVDDWYVVVLGDHQFRYDRRPTRRRNVFVGDLLDGAFPSTDAEAAVIVGTRDSPILVEHSLGQQRRVGGRDGEPRTAHVEGCGGGQPQLLPPRVRAVEVPASAWREPVAERRIRRRDGCAQGLS